MKTMKKLLRKDLSTILGSGPGGCHMGGNSYNCQDDCQCAWGYACEMYEDGNPGQCIAVGGGGNPGGGGGGCNPPSICEEQPY
ncbi:RSAM-modified peptide [Chryseobacterium sp. IT-36CA2]